MPPTYHVDVGPSHPGMADTRVTDGGDGVQIWRVAANVLNKQPRTAVRGVPLAWGWGEGLTTPHHKNPTC
jgi:hypothetical protein